MPDIYKHGVYGDIGESQNLIAEESPTPVVYIGTLPVHLVYDYTDLVNRPVRVRNFAEAQRMVGYSDDWDSFTLCEAIDAHFRNAVQPIGPIYLINALDPETMRGESAESGSLTFTNGTALIPGDTVILNTVTISGKEYGTDFTLSYDSIRKGVVVRDLTGTMTTTPVTYYTVDPGAVTEVEIIGESSETGKTGMQALPLVYADMGVVPMLVAAPGWSGDKNVHDAMLAAANKVNGKFFVFALTDIPLSYMAGQNEIQVNSIEKAQSARIALGFTSEAEKTFWPMAQKVTSSGTKNYHLSTLAAVTMQQVDTSRGGMPYESPSNKPIDASGYYVGDGIRAPLYDEEQANELNASGITSIVKRGGRWRLWGPHTAAFEFSGLVDPRAVFDSSIRMLYYTINDFQTRFADEIDQPLSQNAIDTIINEEKGVLDMWAAGGALLHGDITFQPSENKTEEILAGNFVFNLTVTTAPVLKSITGVLSYTDAGMVELTDVIQEGVNAL